MFKEQEMIQSCFALFWSPGIKQSMKGRQKEKIVGQSVEELPWGWFSIWRQPSRRSPPSGKQGSQDDRDDHNHWEPTYVMMLVIIIVIIAMIITTAMIILMTSLRQLRPLAMRSLKERAGALWAGRWMDNMGVGWVGVGVHIYGWAWLRCVSTYMGLGQVTTTVTASRHTWSWGWFTNTRRRPRQRQSGVEIDCWNYHPHLCYHVLIDSRLLQTI